MRFQRSTLLTGSLVLLAVAAPAFAEDAAGAAAQDDSLLNFLIGLGAAVVSLLLAMFAVKTAMNMFDKVTEGVDEWEELKKGNAAVGLVMAGVILAVGN